MNIEKLYLKSDRFEIVGPYRIPRRRWDVVDITALISVAVFVAAITAIVIDMMS